MPNECREKGLFISCASASRAHYFLFTDKKKTEICSRVQLRLSLEQLTPETCVAPRWIAPYDINAPLFGAYRSKNRHQKYFQFNNASHIVELQDFRAERVPSLYYRYYQQCYSFQIMQLFRYFYPAWGLLNLTQD